MFQKPSLLSCVVVVVFLFATLDFASATSYVIPTNYRVTPTLGNRSSDYVRVTVVTPNTESHSREFTSFFNPGYVSEFKYRWTDMKVYTTLKRVTPGAYSNNLHVGDGLYINVTLPYQGRGVRGVIIGDPCYISKYANCETASKVNLGHNLHELLNAAMSDDSMSYFGIVGDVFYSEVGEVTTEIMQKLSSTFKNKLFLSAPGNYEYWMTGDPTQPTPGKNGDPLGLGYLQIYGTDSQATAQDPYNNPFNFSGFDPDDQQQQLFENRKLNHHHHKKKSQPLPPANNFNSYTIIGNVGFISFSGAYHYHELDNNAREACAYFAQHKPEVRKIIIITHWSRETKGCASKKTTAEGFYNEVLKKYSHLGCPTKKLLRISGHHHCNEILEAGKGFLVGGMGKSDSSCRNLGLPFIDSLSFGMMRIIYFPILHDKESRLIEVLQERKKKSLTGMLSFEEERTLATTLGSPMKRFNALVACAKQPGGLSQCADKLEIEVWLNVSLQ